MDGEGPHRNTTRNDEMETPENNDGALVDNGLVANDPVTNELQTISLKAFDNANKAEGLRRSSRLFLAYCLFHAHNAPLEAVSKNAKGETVFSHAFTIAQFCDEDHVRTACGDDTRAKGAMVAAVIQRISGLQDPTGAQKQALNAAAKVAHGLLVACVDDDGAVDTSQVTLSKRGSVQVPSRLMLKQPDPEKASESEIERFNRESDLPFTLDGTAGRSFNELSSRVAVKKDRPGGNGAGQGSTAGGNITRLDAAKVLLAGAAGADDWAPYLATLGGAEIAAMLALYGEKDEDLAA